MNYCSKTVIQVDSEPIAEALRKREMRARHGGRGGNPVNAEEQGFVVDSGGNVRPVDISEDAGAL